MQISNLTLPHRSSYVLLVFLVLIAGEFLWYRWRRTQGYDLKESAASLVIAVGRRLTRMASSVLLLPVFLWVYGHRLFTIPINNVGSVLGLFLIVEFFYYWFHRFSHTVRWMWASHSVHHSSTKMNLSAAYRVGFTDLFSGDWIFFLMPIWLGFNPVAVLAALGANLTYQILLHTEVIGSLGPLEWIFNTPAHHRVHHAKNESCLDRNFGGILIVYDRLFGTLAKAPENEPLQYGLAQKPASVNPFRIAFGEWLAMFADLWRARTPGSAWRAVFGRP
jgi:sterol desaturase/sphingolipid hydroxylase (fatty acid hydroxylase superfamily)